MTAVDQLREAVDRPHERALAALGRSPGESLEAVSWLSLHLAVVDAVLYRSVRRALPSTRARVAQQRAVDRDLQRALWALDRHLTGDARVRDGSEHLLVVVRRRLAAHDRGEADLLEQLAPELTGAGLEVMLEALWDAAGRGPTRPHPVTPRWRRLAPLAFRADAAVDSLRNALDSRVVPVRSTVLPAARGTARARPPG